MKINFVPTIISIAVSLLISYGFYSYHSGGNKILLSVGGFVFLASTLTLAIGTNFELSRTTTNVRVVSGIFFAICLFSNIIFTFIAFAVPAYVITNGILMLAFILITFLINKAKQ
jgi:hypothetical protein